MSHRGFSLCSLVFDLFCSCSLSRSSFTTFAQTGLAGTLTNHAQSGHVTCERAFESAVLKHPGSPLHLPQVSALSSPSSITGRRPGTMAILALWAIVHPTSLLGLDDLALKKKMLRNFFGITYCTLQKYHKNVLAPAQELGSYSQESYLCCSMTCKKLFVRFLPSQKKIQDFQLKSSPNELPGSGCTWK